MTDIDILFVEDNPGDIRLIEEAFEDQGTPATLHVVQSGDQALDWLFGKDEFAEAPLPKLVLLALSLPAINGLTVLEEIKSDPRLKRLPVIVLTGSNSERELTEAYEARANACLIKPVDPAEFANLIQTFEEFWVSAAALPPIPDYGDPQ